MDSLTIPARPLRWHAGHHDALASAAAGARQALSLLLLRCLLGFLGVLGAPPHALAQAATIVEGAPVFLWGDRTPPGSEGLDLKESVEVRGSDPSRPERMLRGIGRPSLVPFLPARANGSAIIVAPGGGYTTLSYDNEGVSIARRLAAEGFAAFILKYRLPDEGHQSGRLVPLQDAQRAIRLLRHDAARWQIDPARIGILGFSAGGHLAAAAGIDFARETYPPRDALDAVSARPDFMAVIYGAASFQPLPAGSTRPESALTPRSSGTLDAIRATTPPAFLFAAADDVRVPISANIAMWQALRSAGVTAELHVMQRGGHGFGLRESAPESVRSWPDLFLIWLRAIGMQQKR
ncbi:MAG: alpha/beta hydrolase [Candidatus Dactylopiibacterium sp.]|nr:alpha/beta hydrolase [Candidatus Dactylopiibacterium sp.]